MCSEDFTDSMGGSYVFCINLTVVYLAPCRMITSLLTSLVNSELFYPMNIGLFFSKVICLLRLLKEVEHMFLYVLMIVGITVFQS